MASTPQEMIEMFQRMLNPMAFPMQSLLFPSLNAEDLEKKIAELKSIESWLTANLSLLQLSIKTMEYQRSLLTPGDENSGEKPENPFTNPASGLGISCLGQQNLVMIRHDKKTATVYCLSPVSIHFASDNRFLTDNILSYDRENAQL